MGEVEELTLGDLDLPQRRLLVRQGKSHRQRAVYLSDRTMAAIDDYLAVRGEAWSDHLFIYRFRPLSKDLLRDRVKATGRRVGVAVTPHQLRHTFATQLINVGCRITTIQRLLGHEHIQSSLRYARIHDQTVADDYFRAMARIEERILSERES